ncbi:MAG: CPBP family intramembrane metalloprotease [Albidovulum sp.]|nr:CPBP family intramembrane metalloprotease [Albidovulum sp.]MDE0304724.1 CPBP family intramembrane metalloprotease [Albidovulum sp.]MDE0530466.1 CPBP family intramembrane metalloprotease [Albidovulum sp.]
MTSQGSEAPRPAERRHRWLRIEFLCLFLAAPVFLAVFLPPSAMIPALFSVTILGTILLHRTPGFRWRDLARGWNRIDWKVVAAFAIATTVVSAGILMALLPYRWLAVLRMNPWMWLAIIGLYPFLSALPQEIVFRALFFRRYGPILPPARAALALNAAVFSLAHLLYWNWIVATLTFAGGLVFAWAYEVRGSFPLAAVLHAVAGNILFTVGIGAFFYTGTISRPF